jgi:hypothetical protein
MSIISEVSVVSSEDPKPPGSSPVSPNKIKLHFDMTSISPESFEFDCVITTCPRVYVGTSQLHLKKERKDPAGSYEYPDQVANLIRRLFHSRVPSLAIDSVDIQVNTSYLIDELLAQRLGQVAFTCSQLDTLVDLTRCDCPHGCSRCSREVHLDIVAHSWIQPVMSDQLVSSDPSIQPMLGINLAYLPGGGRIQLNGLIRKSNGSNHAKWSPVTVVTYWPKSGDFDRVIETTRASDQLMAVEFCFKVELVGSLTPHQIMTELYQQLKVALPGVIIEHK